MLKEFCRRDEDRGSQNIKESYELDSKPIIFHGKPNLAKLCFDMSLGRAIWNHFRANLGHKLEVGRNCQKTPMFFLGGNSLACKLMLSSSSAFLFTGRLCTLFPDLPHFFGGPACPFYINILYLLQNKYDFQPNNETYFRTFKNHSKLTTRPTPWYRACSI